MNRAQQVIAMCGNASLFEEKSLGARVASVGKFYIYEVEGGGFRLVDKVSSQFGSFYKGPRSFSTLDSAKEAAKAASKS